MSCRAMNAVKEFVVGRLWSRATTKNNLLLFYFPKMCPNREEEGLAR